MSISRFQGVLIASLAAVLPGVAQAASPLLNVEVLGSTTGQAGSYVSDLSSINISTGTQISFEVIAVAAPAGTTNGTKSTNGTTDGVNSFPSFSLSGGNGTFLTDAVAAAFNQPPSASAGTISGGTISNVVTSAGAGNYVSIDGTGAVVLTGTFTVGSEASESIGVALSGSTNGTAKFSGSLTSVPESNAGGLIGFASLTVKATPEPTTLALGMLGIPALLARRRR